MFVNTMPRYEILSADSIAVLDRGWRRIVSEIGIQFAKPEAVELFAKAGQQVDGDVVKLDPEFVLEQVAKAPREFDVQARNPAHNVHIGGDHMVFSSVYGCPFVREGDVRRDATLNDFRQLAMLSQAYDELDSAGGVICEPNDAPLDSRHLDMIYALQTLTDKIYMGNVVSGPNAADTIRMTEILFGGRAAIEQTPATISLINCNSPLRWDDRMLDAQFEYCAAGQPVVLTPFLLMGAMSPVTDPGRAGPAAGRGAVRHRAGPADPAGLPGDLRLVPVQHRHAVRVAVVRDPGVGHRPAVHRPAGPALRPAVPHRRRAELQPDRGRAVRVRGADDAAADLPGRHELRHARGRLAGRRPGQLLREVHHRHRAAARCCGWSSPRWRSPRNRSRSARTPRSATAGTSSAPSTRWSGSATCFYRPLLSSTANFERWLKLGGKDTAARAGEIWRAKLDVVRAAAAGRRDPRRARRLRARRRRELGD